MGNNQKLSNALRYANAMKYCKDLDRAVALIEKKRSLQKQWMINARKLHKSDEKKPCIVCGGYAGLTESHHLYELHLQRRLGVKNADQTCVWLCPTHHRIIHRINGDNDEDIEKISANLTEQELDKFMELLVMKNKIKRKLLKQMNRNL